MGATTELSRPGAADVDHANGVTVLLAEERHRPELLRLIQREHTRGHLEVVAHRVVRDLLDLGLRRVRQLLRPREVESHIARPVQRPGLRRRRTQGVPQRRVDQVRGRVGLTRGAPIGGIDDRRRRRTHPDLTGGDLDRVADQAGDRPLHVDDVELEAGADDHPLVGDLPARLGVQRRLGQDDLRDLARRGPVDRHAADQHTQHRALGLEIGVAGEHRLALRAEVAIDTVIGDRALAAPGVVLRTLALLLHERVEGRTVHLEAGLLRDLDGQIDREPVGVVQQERLGAGQRRAARVLRVRDREVEDGRSRREGAQERLLLREGVRGQPSVVALQLGVGGLHGVTRRREQLRERGFLDAEQTHGTDRAAHQTPEDVAATLVGGRHAIRQEHERGAHVVGDDAEPHVVLVVGAVAPARELHRPVEHRPHLVGLVHVLDTLLQERDTLEPHARVDVLLRQVADDVEVELRAHVRDGVLHEDEVPDLHVAVVVGRRSAVDAVRRTAVEEDLRARSGRPRLPRAPVVAVLAQTLDAVGRDACDRSPQRLRLVVVLVDRDPEILRIETETALAVAAGEQLPRVADRAFLEVIPKRPVAEHLEEGAVPRRLADLFDVVGADALLHVGRSGVRGGDDTGEIRDERHHAGDGEQQRRVAGHERGRRDDRVAVVLEVVEIALGDVSGLHAVLRGETRLGRRPAASVVQSAFLSVTRSAASEAADLVDATASAATSATLSTMPVMRASCSR